MAGSASVETGLEPAIFAFGATTCLGRLGGAAGPAGARSRCTARPREPLHGAGFPTSLTVGLLDVRGAGSRRQHRSSRTSWSAAIAVTFWSRPARAAAWLNGVSLSPDRHRSGQHNSRDRLRFVLQVHSSCGGESCLVRGSDCSLAAPVSRAVPSGFLWPYQLFRRAAAPLVAALVIVARKAHA